MRRGASDGALPEFGLSQISLEGLVIMGEFQQSLLALALES